MRTALSTRAELSRLNLPGSMELAERETGPNPFFDPDVVGPAATAQGPTSSRSTPLSGQFEIETLERIGGACASVFSTSLAARPTGRPRRA